jgi:CRISPR-associated exonuclease Cas4
MPTLPLSALQHYMFCPRQCALIHVEKVWAENRFTAEGRLLHLRVDSGAPGRRAGVAEDRSVPIRSDELGLYGVADMLEMRPGTDFQDTPYPVEYKRGSPKILDCDRVQLCAQAICLEEMLKVEIPEGAIFYGKPRRRERIAFDEALRQTVRKVSRAVHDLIDSETTPPATPGKHCTSCSLHALCLPKANRTRVEAYLHKGLDS